MKTISKAVLFAVLGLGVANTAFAADIIEEPVPVEPVPVEVGSGWYLRGDVSYDFKSDLDFGKYKTYGQTSGCCGKPVYEYGKQSYDDFDIDHNFNAGVGFGYQFTDYFRGDLTAHYWKSDVRGHDRGDYGVGQDCIGDFYAGAVCTSKDKTDIKAWELMANAYVDLGTFAGFTPYAGAGVGAVHVKYDDLKNVATCSGSVHCPSTPVIGEHPGESDWRFAYALMAGVGYDLTQSLKLDVGYRFVDVDGGDMFGWDKYSAGAGATGVQGKDDGFHRHTIQAGLRYSFF